MSTSVVGYEGFLTSAAATIAPAIRFDAARLSLGAQGSWTVFESGNQIYQATAAAAWLSSLQARWRVELSGATGLSRYAREPGSGHLLARSRLHFAGEGAGGWAGVTSGAVFDATSQTPIELSLGAWRATGGVMWVGTISHTWLGGANYFDIMGAARLTAGRLEVEARAGARPWTFSNGDIGEAIPTAFGEVSTLIALHERIGLALSAGSYPSDPIRRVLAAKYLTAGLRLGITGSQRSGNDRELAYVPRLTTAAGNQPAAAGDNKAADNQTISLEISPSLPTHTLRISAPGASAVEIMGDFTDWQVVPLKKSRTGVWESRFPLTTGVHRLNVRVDGGKWVVPAGARSEEGEFGGAVGVVVVR